MARRWELHEAVRRDVWLRLAVYGPSGSGKTYSMLSVAKTLGEKIGSRVAVIDTENKSATKYADRFKITPINFTPEEKLDPQCYIDAVDQFVDDGYKVIVVDSLSHAWAAILNMVDEVTKRSKSNNAFTTGWREASPMHNKLVERIISAEAHILAGMRVKTEYVMEKDERTGKVTPKRVGLSPVQREGVEYEFDIVGDMTLEHELIITKSRCFELQDKIITKPGEAFALQLWNWANGGEKGSASVPESKPVTTPPINRGVFIGEAVQMEEVLKENGKLDDDKVKRLRVKYGDNVHVEKMTDDKLKYYHGKLVEATTTAA